MTERRAMLVDVGPGQSVRLHSASLDSGEIVITLKSKCGQHVVLSMSFVDANGVVARSHDTELTPLMPAKVSGFCVGLGAISVGVNRKHGRKAKVRIRAPEWVTIQPLM